MPIPAFGHGELEWAVDNGTGKLVVKYALPWEHPKHKPNLMGSAIFYEEAGTIPVHYAIRYVARATTPTAHTMLSADGRMQVQIAADGTQTHDLYFALIQGYPPPAVNEPVLPVSYELRALRVPEPQNAALADINNWHYPWRRDTQVEQLLPKEYTVKVTLHVPGELCRWIGWKDPAPPNPMEDVDPIEMTKLRKLGIFMIETKDAPAPEPWAVAPTA